MQKNIALFLDGTRNSDLDDGRPENTNVQKLHKAAICDGSVQITKYISGVGTDGSWIDDPLGAYGGLGTAYRIRESYSFLARHYKSGDNIYLFGFSRGAFAARSLSGFVKLVGGLLLEEEIGNKLEEAYGLYESSVDGKQPKLREFLRDIKGVSKVTGFAPEGIPVYFIGVWDTVSALGFQFAMYFNRFFSEYHQIELPPNVSHARHALAIHETRKKFKPILWRGCSKKGQTLKQVWFPGAHADVGGGYPETGLSDVALNWMAEEAKAKKLLLSGLPSREGSWGTRTFHQEFKHIWYLATPITRSELNVFGALYRQPAKSFYLHQSVCEHLLSNQARQYRFPKRTNNKIREADESSLRLLLTLSFKHNKLPVGREKAPVSGDCAPDGARVAAVKSRERAWWANVCVDEVSQCERAVQAFISAPRDVTRDETRAFARALCLLVLCIGDDAIERLPDTTKRFCDETLRSYVKGRGPSPLLSKWQKRLRAIETGVKEAITMLPSGWNSELISEIATKLENQRARLNTEINLHNLKKKRPCLPFRPK